MKPIGEDVLKFVFKDDCVGSNAHESINSREDLVNMIREVSKVQLNAAISAVEKSGWDHQLHKYKLDLRNSKFGTSAIYRLEPITAHTKNSCIFDEFLEHKKAYVASRNGNGFVLPLTEALNTLRPLLILFRMTSPKKHGMNQEMNGLNTMLAMTGTAWVKLTKINSMYLYLPTVERSPVN